MEFTHFPFKITIPNYYNLNRAQSLKQMVHNRPKGNQLYQ